MIIYPVETHPQGSANWARARLGIPTASEFHRILTPTGNLSAQSRNYAFRLIAELLLKEPMETVEGLRWMERGQELEPEAVRFYEFQNDIKTEESGFITTDDGQIGCSPDRLVGPDGLLELKCPAPQTHIGYMEDGIDKEYKPQLQGQLYVSERQWVDWVSHHPELPPVCIRVRRDDAYISKLEEALDRFVTLKNEMLIHIRENGFFAERDRILEIGEREASAHLNEVPVDALEEILSPLPSQTQRSI